MVIDTGRVFEIYSVGDGEFMRRVIDSVAAMSNSGLLVQLVGFGLMIGLLIMGFRNVMAGGTKLDLGTTLVAVILGGIMFGLKADVIIHDMNFAPGEIDQPTYRVDNVPFGIAAAGYLISGSGFALTETMEQGYGLYAGGRSSLIEGGFGNTLEWINSLRMWEVPTFNDSGKEVGRFRENLGTYINECTMPAIEMGHLRYDAIAVSTNLFSMGDAAGGGGFGYGSQYVMFQYAQANGTQVALTCGDGFATIQADADTILPVFAEALSRAKLGMSSEGMEAAQAMEDAFASVGIDTGEMQQLVLAEAVGMSLHNAVSGRTSSAALSTQTKMMIEQASTQRAVQWAAEETMFRRVMRPMMAFFESLIYALAPLMALMIGMGTFGIQTVMKYMMLSIWVVLWLPMLSIIQLYQITMMQHGVNGLQTTMDGLGTGVGTSIAGADQVRQLAIDWLGTGAAMAAFTPALTMALVWGGAVTASALANRMQGGDHINEKQTAPDATSTPPAIGAGSSFEATRAGGMTMGGSQSSIPSINMASASEWGMSSARSALASAQEQYSAAVSSVYNQTYGTGNTVRAGSSVEHSGFSASSDMGQYRTGASATTDSAARVENTLAGSNTSVVASSADTSASAGLPGEGVLPVGAKASVSGQNRDATEVQDALRVAQASGKSSSASGSFASGWDGSAGQRLQSAVSKAADSDASFRQNLANSEEVRRAEQAINQAQSMFQEQSAYSQRFGMSQNVPLNVLATDANREGRAGDLAQAVVAGGLAEKAKEIYGRLGHISDSGTRETAANIAALYEGAQNGTRGGVSQELADFRASAFTDAMSGSTGTGSFFAGGLRPESNEGQMASAPNYDAIREKGERAQAPSGNPQAVVGTVQSALAGDASTIGAMAAESNDAVGASPGSFGSMDATAGHRADEIAAAGGTAAMGAVDRQGTEAVADRASGMTAGVLNAAGQEFSIDTEGRLDMHKLDRMAGMMPEELPDGGLVPARTDQILSESPFLGRDLAQAIATGQVLESHGPGGVTEAQYDQLESYMEQPGASILVDSYGNKQSGAAARTEGQLLHNAGQETLKDRVERGDYEGGE